MAEWYWKRNGQVHGPVDIAELQQLAKRGELRPTDTIRCEDVSVWVLASHAHELEFGIPLAETPENYKLRPSSQSDASDEYDLHLDSPDWDDMLTEESTTLNPLPRSKRSKSVLHFLSAFSKMSAAAYIGTAIGTGVCVFFLVFFVVREGFSERGSSSEPLSRPATTNPPKYWLDRSYATIQAISSPAEQQKALKALAAVQARGGDFEAAIAALQEIDPMLDRAAALESIASFQAKTGDFEAAFLTVPRVEYHYDRAKALESIALALADRGKIEEAKKTLRSAIAIAQQIEYQDDKEKVLRSLAQSCCHVEKDMNYSIQYIQDDRQRQTKIFQYTAINQAETGDIETALATAQKITVADILGDTLQSIALIQQQAGDPDGAKQTAQLVLDKLRQAEEELKCKTIKMLAFGQAKLGNTEALAELARQIENDSWKIEALISIASALTETGQNDLAKTTLQSAIDIQQRTPDLRNSTPILSNICLTQFKMNDLEAALATAQKTHREYNKAQILLSIASAQIRAGNQDQAQNTLELVYLAAQKIKNQKDKHDAFSKLAFEQARIGNFDIAIEIAQQLKDKQDRGKTLTRIAIEQAKHGYFNLAQAIASQMPQGHNQRKILYAVAAEQAKAGDFKNAIAIAKRIHYVDFRAELLTTIALEQTKIGDFTAATHTIEHINSSPEKREAYKKIAATRIQNGFLDEVAQWSEKMERAQSLPPSCVCYIHLAIAKNRLKNFPRETYQNSL